MRFSLFIFCLVINLAQATDHVWRYPKHGDLNTETLHNDNTILGSYGIYPYDTGTALFNGNSSWNVNDFTSANIKVDKYHQASVGTGYGNTSVQREGDKFAAQLHSWSINSPTNYFSIAWGGTINGFSGVKAWDSKFSNNPKFCTGYFQTVPKHYTSGAALYIFTGIILKDPTYNNEIHVTIHSWDNRGYKNEDVYKDAHNNVGINTYYGKNTKFGSLMDYSASISSSNYSNEKWFGVCLTKTNLANIVKSVKSKYPSHLLSTNYENYLVKSLTIQPEIGNENKGGWFSMTARENWVFTRY